MVSRCANAKTSASAGRVRRNSSCTSLGPVDGLAVPTPYDFDQHAEEAELTAQGKADGEIEQGDAAREPLGDGRDVAEREIGECDLQLRQQSDISAEVVVVGERTELDRDLPALRDRGGLLQRKRAGVERLRDQLRITEAKRHRDRVEARPVANARASTLCMSSVPSAPSVSTRSGESASGIVRNASSSNAISS